MEGTPRNIFLEMARKAVAPRERRQSLGGSCWQPRGCSPAARATRRWRARARRSWQEQRDAKRRGDRGRGVGVPSKSGLNPTTKRGRGLLEYYLY